MSDAEVGMCSECRQELILTANDCWHPWSVERACPPERMVGSVAVIDWGDGYGRPGRDKFVNRDDV